MGRAGGFRVQHNMQKFRTRGQGIFSAYIRVTSTVNTAISTFVIFVLSGKILMFSVKF